MKLKKFSNFSVLSRAGVGVSHSLTSAFTYLFAGSFCCFYLFQIGYCVIVCSPVYLFYWVLLPPSDLALSPFAGVCQSLGKLNILETCSRWRPQTVSSLLGLSLHQVKVPDKPRAAALSFLAHLQFVARNQLSRSIWKCVKDVVHLLAKSQSFFLLKNLVF